MNRSRAFGGIALLAGAAVALSGCSSGSGGSNAANNGPQNSDPTTLATSQPYHRPKVPESGTVTVAVDETMTDYNNDLGSTDDVANFYITNLMLPTPFFINDVNNTTKVQLDGDLMSSVNLVSKSPQVIQWNINPKAVWQDGAPVDCSDFYLQWLSGEKDTGDVATTFNNVIPGFDHVSKVECSNNGKTVTTTFSKPWADWQGLFQLLVPAHVLEKATGVPDVTKLDQNNPADHADLMKVANFYSGSNGVSGFAGINLAYDLSAGPYMLKSADGKGETVLVRNPKWWGNPAGPAEVDVKTNTDDQSAFQQLQNKEINVAAGQPNAQVADTVKAAGAPFKLETGLGQTFEHLDYNVVNPVFKAYPELKTALSQCVNRQDIINKVVADVDSAVKPLGNVLILPNAQGYTNDFGNTGNGDENAAKQTLQSHGWKQNANGVFEKNGQLAQVTIGHKTNDRRENTVKAIQAECKAAGIQVNDYSSDGFNANDLPAGNYQVALFAWTGSPFTSSLNANYQTNGGSNFQKYSDPQVDKLLDAAAGELDYPTRIKDYQQADALMAKDGDTLPLYALPEYAVTDGSYTATNQQGQKSDIQDNEASSGVLWDVFTWQKGRS